jgi:hypothetical protein
MEVQHCAVEGSLARADSHVAVSVRKFFECALLDIMAGTPAAQKAGAALFLLWSVLHLWVPLEGYRVYLTEGAAGCFHMLTGGAKVPHGAYKVSPDAATVFANTHLFLNFVTDVGSAGVLGLFVARGLWLNENPWLCYTLGTVVIGICDLAFLFFMVLSGVIALGPETVAGPVIWFVAVAVTPFGLPKTGKKSSVKKA